MFNQTNTAIDLDISIAPVRKEEAKKIEPHWFGQQHEENYEGQCRFVVESFVKGRPLQKYHMKVSTGRHVYSTKANGAELWLYKANPVNKVHILIAKKINGVCVGNSSSIMAQRQIPNKGKKRGKLAWTGGAQKIQEVLGQAMAMVPFRVLKDAQLDINDMTIIEKAQDEMLDLGLVGGPRHYTGALLFKIGVNKRSRGVQGKSEEYFLFDIDRNDLKMKNLNAFISKLRGPAVSIKDAYEQMKPKEVADAERFLGRPCERQGEWFFIPVQGNYKRATQHTYSHGLGRPAYKEAVLKSNGNRAHYVEQLSEEGYVRGKVTHGGSEHTPITLEGWHKPVPNTTIQSFKISGQVD